MPLIDLKTNLKSLKYGHDRPGGGDSNQPYITNDINDPKNRLGFDDGLIRGGAIGAAKASINDTARIGKFLTDLPKGPLFIVKQVGLQLSNPKLESLVNKTGIGFLNRLSVALDNVGIGSTRIYNLGINTLAQVPVNAFGIHLNRHGLLPVQDDSTKYLSVVQKNNQGTGSTNAKLLPNSPNRLLRYAEKLLPATPPIIKSTSVIKQLLSLIPGASLFMKPKQMMISEYVGGPGSVYGVGKTFIRRYDYTSNGFNKQQPQDRGKINYPGTLGLSTQYFQPPSLSVQNIIKNSVQNSSLSSLSLNGLLGLQASAFSLIVKSASVQINSYNHIDLANPTTPPSQINNTAVKYRNNIPAGANGTSNSPTSRTYEDLKAQILTHNQKPQPHSTIGGNPGNVQYFGDLGVSRDYFYDPFDIEEGDTALEVNNITNDGKSLNHPSAITYTSNNAVLKYIELQKKVSDSQLLKDTNSVGLYTTAVNGTRIDNTKGAYSTTPLVDSVGSGSIQYKNSYGEIVKIKAYKSWSAVSRENRVGSGRKDAINLTPVFSKNTGTIGDKVKIPGVVGTNPDGSCNIRDLVKFRIQAIDGTNPNSSDWMIFRAYVTQYSDSVDASWNSVKYAGRGEDFYIYGGFGRKIQIGFKVASLSIGEMQPMYQKLNYLMSNLMPDYNGTLMRGPLVKMTVGNWLDGQAGILNSLSYTVPQDSPWEISLGEDLTTGVGTLILPHVVEVSMTFTPIGSQTQGVNKISEKSYSTSHIAQNINSNETQYITGSILQGT
jgi:hypothetical protein